MEDAVYQEFLDLEQQHWWFRGRRAIFIALLDRHLGRAPRSGRRIMDLGCGVGGMIRPLAEYGDVIGTDVTLRGLEHCAARGFSRLVACTGHEGCFADASLDCITAFDALEHIEDDVGALREIERILKPGGLLVASGPAYQFLYAQQDRVTHHVRRYTVGEFTEKAERAGLAVVKASYINFLLFPAILPAVLLLKWKQKLSPSADRGAGSNVGIPMPGFVNAALTAVFSSEARLLRWISAPAGHSFIVVARKPG
jgi:SAM-dependent methyltransferase